MRPRIKVIDNPDAPSPRRSDREIDLESWDEAQANAVAAQEGIELDKARWEVIHCLRDYYLNQDPPESGRQISDMLDERFADRGGNKYLRRLFPNGPVTQGMRIAGLPLPPHTMDEGFGVNR